MKSKKIVVSFGLLICTVVSTCFVTISTAQQGTQAAADLDYPTGAVLYMQKAAEYRALSFQSFNLARWQLDADLDKKNVKKLPKTERKMLRAIIVDIDETVLDNSPAQAYAAKNGIGFNVKDWYAWGEMRKAKAIIYLTHQAEVLYGKIIYRLRASTSKRIPCFGY
ncbi:MAG: HAD family acid phosphatase [Pyrinomonadaceae bacterium]